MGCQCQLPGGEEINEVKAKDEIQSLDINENLKSQNINNLSSRSHNGEPEDLFSKYIFEQINALRQNPQSFIDKIENAKKNIKEDKSGIKIYKTSVKVALAMGEKAFDEAIEVLKNTEPMEKFKYNPDFVIDLPTNEEDVKSKEYIINQVKLKIEQGIDIKSFWKDLVRDVESCFILTIVDDTGKNSGKKRSDILNKENKYIGISTARIGKSFACYIAIG